VHRARRRLIRNLAGGAVALTIAIAVVAGGASVLVRIDSTHTPAAPTGATSIPTTSIDSPTPTSAPSGAPETSALTWNLVPDAGALRRDGEVLEHACCNGAIAAVDPASGDRRMLLRPGGLGAAAWSPDGTRLAFEIGCSIFGGATNPSVPCMDGSEDAGFSLMNATGKPTRIASYFRSGRPFSPYDRHFAWSPDGSKIALMLLGEGIYVANADGSNATLVGSPFDEFHGPPSWAPDGSALTYATEEGVFVVTSSGESTQLTDDGENPVWSPDGSRIAFSLSHAVFVVRPDGSDLKQIGDGYEFAWSPSGDRLVYHLEDRLDSGFAEQLWVVGADGSDPTEIVDSSGCGGHRRPHPHLDTQR
jgi:Tol biopolymer transport system component